MTLKCVREQMIEPPQRSAIQNAGGSGMSGSFEIYMVDMHGFRWELTLKDLTFEEVVRIAEAAREILR
jgi:hypothetical protein